MYYIEVNGYYLKQTISFNDKIAVRTSDKDKAFKFDDVVEANVYARQLFQGARVLKVR